jgi:hypothetical protein
VCQWYQNDFQPGLLHVVHRHLRGDKGVLLQQLIDETSNGKNIVYKYLPFTFESRHLTSIDDDGVIA